MRALSRGVSKPPLSKTPCFPISNFRFFPTVAPQSRMLGEYLCEISCLLRALGPQQSLFAVNLDRLCALEPWEEVAECAYEGDLALLSSKSLLALRCLGAENAYSSVLVDMLESFHLQHGTGTSSLLAWVVLLLEDALQSSEREPLLALLEMMEEFETLYISTAEAIALDMEQLMESTVARQRELDAGAGEVAASREPKETEEEFGSDTSWFFLSDDTNAAAIADCDSGDELLALAQNLPSLESASKSKSKSQSRSGAKSARLAELDSLSLAEQAVWSEQRIVNALQHCLPSDFPRQGVVDGACLPMHLAVQATRPLLCDRDIESAHISAILRQPRSAITVLTVPGCPAEHCRVVTDGVFFRLPVSLSSQLRVNDDGGSNSSSSSSSSSCKAPRKFSRALCLSLDEFNPGSTGCGGGASAAANSVNVVQLRSFVAASSEWDTQSNNSNSSSNSTAAALFDPLNPLSLQFSPTALYSSKVVAKLLCLGVTLLVAPQEAATQQVIDLCQTHGVTLLPVPRKLLVHVAAVVGCVVVSDVLDALEEHCSRHACELSLLDCLGLGGGASVAPPSATSSQCLVQLARSSSATNSDIGDPSCWSCGVGVPTPSQSSSVLLCAPTLAQARSWQDRFWRCTRRLVLGYTGSGLVPAGLTEALCIALLQRRMDMERSFGQEGPSATATGLFLRYSALLEKFWAVVASNGFGCDRVETHSQVQRSVAAISAELAELAAARGGGASGRQGTSLLVELDLTKEQKLRLWRLAPRPLTRCEDTREAPALDVCSVKVEAVRTAVTTAKLLLLGVLSSL